jgi:hypothetical protein
MSGIVPRTKAIFRRLASNWRVTGSRKQPLSGERAATTGWKATHCNVDMADTNTGRNPAYSGPVERPPQPPNRSMKGGFDELMEFM